MGTCSSIPNNDSIPNNEDAGKGGIKSKRKNKRGAKERSKAVSGNVANNKNERNSKKSILNKSIRDNSTDHSDISNNRAFVNEINNKAAASNSIITNVAVKDSSANDSNNNKAAVNGITNQNDSSTLGLFAWVKEIWRDLMNSCSCQENIEECDLPVSHGGSSAGQSISPDVSNKRSRIRNQN